MNYVLTTKDGRMYDGVIANETPNAITLRGGSEEGDETVLRKNIASFRNEIIANTGQFDTTVNGIRNNRELISGIKAFLRMIREGGAPSGS